jgi:prophage regulatory protein
MVFLRFANLREKGITFSRVHIGRLVKARQFPKPVPLGSNSVAWIEAEVDAWIASRVAARDEAA